MFNDWDCSIQSFEGIRSQDILPLLLDQFCFHLFFGFANIIEPFVDRNFGPNFDAAAEWDRAFIDEVNERDEAEILSGRIKRTHMLAVVANRPASRLICREPLTPAFCLRPLAASHAGGEISQKPDVYQTDAWPRWLQREVVTVCGWLKESKRLVKDLKSELERVNQLFEERTARALQLDTEVRQSYAELEQRTAWALRLDKEVQDLYAQFEQRTKWALHLKAESEQLSAQLEERTAWAQRLDIELEQSDAQVQRLAKELEERTAWALRLDQELKSLSCARRVHRYLRRIFSRRLRIRRY